MSRDTRILVEVAEWLRSRGFPCGVYGVPAPSEMRDAQAAFDAELERIIAEMLVDVPARIAATDRADADLQALIDRGKMPF